MDRVGVSANVASFVGLSQVWKCVMGNSHARPTPAQFEEMKKLIREAMEQGAVGLSCMLAMPPGSLATTDDIVELAKVIAPYKGVFMAHIRNEGTAVFEAIREVIEIGRRAGVQVEILHIKIADQQYWGKMNEIIALVNKARGEGVNIQANIYPYTRGHNNLASIIPPWAHEGGSAKMIQRLKDPKERERLKKDIKEGIPGWYNHYTAVGGDWSRMLLSGKGSYSGLTMDRVLALRSKKDPAPTDPLDHLFNFLIEEGGSISCIYEHHTDKDMTLALSQPWVGIGSDGLAYATSGPLRRGHPHPRSFGTFPRVLGVYTRQQGILKLEDAVRKMTSMNAAKLGLTDRGLLRIGDVADITIFDADKIIDKATYTDPFQYPVGIEYVIVNGQVVLEKGEHTGATPGRALRRNQALVPLPKVQKESRPSNQNPSPMVERTRPHPRLKKEQPAGRREKLTLGTLFVPSGLKMEGTLPLLVHFHGSDWLPEVAAARLGKSAVISVQLGSGSSTYARPFKEPECFGQLIREAESKIGLSLGPIVLSGWSAGYGAIREILTSPDNYARVEGVLLIDGLHAGYRSGKPGPLESQLIDDDLAVFVKWAEDAVAGKKSFMLLHTEIFPGTFASTTETADYLLGKLNLKRQPVLEWGPLQTQQLSEVRQGRFVLRGYAGNSAPDHVDLLHALPDWLKSLP